VTTSLLTVHMVHELKLAPSQGLEPRPSDSESDILPLNYKGTPGEGIEPPQYGSKPYVLPLDDPGKTRPNCASLCIEEAWRVC
jgi:hypothetical protein